MSSTSSEYLTVSEAAELLRVSVSTIRRWIRDGTITAHRAGQRRLLLTRADVTSAMRTIQLAGNPTPQVVRFATAPPANRATTSRPTNEYEEKSRDLGEMPVPVLRFEEGHDDLEIMAPEAWEDIREAREFRTEQLMGEHDLEFDQFDIGVLASMIIHSPDRPRRRLLTSDEQRRMLHALENAERTRERIRRRSGERALRGHVPNVRWIGEFRL
jgi:excisionase family DNA binding protein